MEIIYYVKEYNNNGNGFTLLKNLFNFHEKSFLFYIIIIKKQLIKLIKNQ